MCGETFCDDLRGFTAKFCIQFSQPPSLHSCLASFEHLLSSCVSLAHPWTSNIILFMNICHYFWCLKTTCFTNPFTRSLFLCFYCIHWLYDISFSALTLVCWLGVRKSIRPIKNWVMGSDGVLAWLSVWSVVQMICIWSSWCYCHPSSLASVKSRMVYLSVASLPRLSWKKGH